MLTKEENVIDIQDMIFATKYDDPQAALMLLHLIEGDRQAKQFTGIHYLPSLLPDYVVNYRIVYPPDSSGVYTASFEIIESNGKILKKENLSTMFPKEWSRQRLYDECLLALTRRIKMKDKSSSFTSVTKCGIPVEIHFDKDERKIRTLYPIRVELNSKPYNSV